MIGNGILAFAIIFIVVIFVYMSLRLKRDQDATRYYTEAYNISLTKGFVGDSLSIFINDSLLMNKRITEEPFIIEVNRFDEESALMIVDNLTEKISLFELSNKGGKASFVKEADGVKQLAQ